MFFSPNVNFIAHLLREVLALKTMKYPGAECGSTELALKQK